MAKVCKSDGQGTFAGTQGNGEVAPIPAVRGTAIEPRGSTPTRRAAEMLRKLSIIFLSGNSQKPTTADPKSEPGKAARKSSQ